MDSEMVIIVNWNMRLSPVTYNGKFLSDAKSMVANAPDSKCIWFDKSGTR